MRMIQSSFLIIAFSIPRVHLFASRMNPVHWLCIHRGMSYFRPLAAFRGARSSYGPLVYSNIGMIRRTDETMMVPTQR